MSNRADWKKSVTVSIPPELLERVDNCVDAERLIESRSALTRVALEDFLNERDGKHEEKQAA
jgi:metal-responsive CopG/Arc/MetJ family transcriptional regulator